MDPVTVKLGGSLNPQKQQGRSVGILVGGTFTAGSHHGDKRERGCTILKVPGSSSVKAEVLWPTQKRSCTDPFGGYAATTGRL